MHNQHGLFCVANVQKKLCTTKIILSSIMEDLYLHVIYLIIIIRSINNIAYCHNYIDILDPPQNLNHYTLNKVILFCTTCATFQVFKPHVSCKEQRKDT